VDFLVGFTIFIFSLLVVANMVPSLLVGLQRTIAIDYDAVAYRTAVILVEDPGEPTVPDNYLEHDPLQYRWDSQTPAFLKALMQGSTAVRFGLAVSRESPNVLSQRKINLFFDPAFTVEDFRKSLIFGDIHYGFNITLTRLDSEPIWTLGSPYPEGRYGYIRRYVKIKNYTNETITNTTHPEFNATTQYENPTANQFQVFTVSLDGTRLYVDGNKYIYSPPYVIDPTQDNITVNLSMEGFLNNSHLSPFLYGDRDKHDTTAWAQNCPPLNPLNICDLDPWSQGKPPNYATLKAIIFRTLGGTVITGNQLVASGAKVTVFYHDPDTADTMVRLTDLSPNPKVRVGRSLNLTVSSIPETFMDLTKGLDIVYIFEENPVITPDGTSLYIPRTLLNRTFIYDYANVTQDALSPGILEVAIW
jgi:hypothetical protein